MTRFALVLVALVLVGAYLLSQLGASVVQGWMTATGIGG